MMKVEIVQIANPGEPNQERVHLAVRVATSLEFFVLLKSVATESGGVLCGGVSAFWFPTLEVKPFDQVILYTKAGSNSSQRTDSGGTHHFLHWGLSTTVFNGTNDAAVLMEIQEWQTKARASRSWGTLGALMNKT